MNKGICLPFSLLMLLLNFPLKAAQLSNIEFQQVGDASQLILTLDKPDVNAERFNVVEDKQIMLDLSDTNATERVMRAFDTSEFSGSVIFVTAYKKPNTKNDLRIAIQLRDNVRSILERSENNIILSVENRFGVFSQSKISQKETYLDKKLEAGLGEINIPKSTSLEDILENLTMSGRKKYVGKRISFNVKDLKVDDILKMIADASGFNVIITKDIKELPPLTLNLTNIPWDQALDTILNINKLIAKKNGSILLIDTLANETRDKKLENEARRLALKEERLVTKIFPISYASTKDLEKILTEYLTPKRGKVSEDVRTNSLIIKDTPETMEKIKKIIETLDTQTPQVLIESKVVEVAENYSQELGLKKGLVFGYDPIGSNGNTPSPVGVPEVTPGDNGGPGFSFSSSNTAEQASGFFGLAIAKYSRLTNLNFQLQLMESESKAKIITSPKVITQNKKKAVINTKETTSYAVQTGVGIDAVTTFEEIEAKLTLEVTPQITNEGSIVLDIKLLKEQFAERPYPAAPPNKLSRDIDTSVLVENGSTIVIGGIYAYENTQNYTGVPWLDKIPIVGWLFRTPYNPKTSKREMIIFLTPRIINQEEAGLESGIKEKG
jgi:type IV pilus assembly protein PilQ